MKQGALVTCSSSALCLAEQESTTMRRESLPLIPIALPTKHITIHTTRFQNTCSLWLCCQMFPTFEAAELSKFVKPNENEGSLALSNYKAKTYIPALSLSFLSKGLPSLFCAPSIAPCDVNAEQNTHTDKNKRERERCKPRAYYVSIPSEKTIHLFRMVEVRSSLTHSHKASTSFTTMLGTYFTILLFLVHSALSAVEFKHHNNNSNSSNN